jgi:hypothetical protein
LQGVRIDVRGLNVGAKRDSGHKRTLRHSFSGPVFIEGTPFAEDTSEKVDFSVTNGCRKEFEGVAHLLKTCD